MSGFMGLIVVSIALGYIFGEVYGWLVFGGWLLIDHYISAYFTKPSITEEL